MVAPSQAGLFSGDHLPLQQVERSLLGGDVVAARRALHGRGGGALLAVRSILDVLDVATGGDWDRGLPDPRAWHRAWVEAFREPESRGAEKALPVFSWGRIYALGAAQRLDATGTRRLRGLPTPAWWWLAGEPDQAVRAAWDLCRAGVTTGDLIDAARILDALQPGEEGRGPWIAALLRDPPADPRRPPPSLDGSGHTPLDLQPPWQRPWPLAVLDGLNGVDLPGAEAAWIPALVLADGVVDAGLFFDPRVRDAAEFDPAGIADAPHRDAVRALLRPASPDRARVLDRLLPGLARRVRG